MHDTAPKVTTHASIALLTPDSVPATPPARLVPDHVIAPMLGVSVAFLQRDRREARRIPFIRLGDRVLYDPDEVMTAVKAMTVGGPRGTRRGPK